MKYIKELNIDFDNWEEYDDNDFFKKLKQMSYGDEIVILISKDNFYGFVDMFNNLINNNININNFYEKFKSNYILLFFDKDQSYSNIFNMDFIITYSIKFYLYIDNIGDYYDYQTHKWIPFLNLTKIK